MKHFLNLASVVTGYISISAFTSLPCIFIEITSSAIGSEICTITERKKKSIIKKKKRNMIK